MKSSFIVTKTVFALVIAILACNTGNSKSLARVYFNKHVAHKTNTIYYAASKRDCHGLGVYYRYDPALGRRPILVDLDTVNGKERTPLSTRLTMNSIRVSPFNKVSCTIQTQKEQASKRNECC